MYTPTEEQKKQAKGAMDQASLVIGRFVLAWSRVEANLRTLELMHVGNYCFRPVENLKSINLNKTLRFADRVKLVIPKHIEGERLAVHEWLLHAHKVRNLILHGMMIFHGAKGSNVRTPAIVHSDFTSTLFAGKGFPDSSRAHIPVHKNSLSPDTSIHVAGLDVLIDEAKQVEKLLFGIIEKTHELGYFGHTKT